mgnify:FL=1
MRSINFTHIAASCRQAYNGVRRPVIVLESCFNMSPSQIPQMIRFFYEDERLEERLRDEDLREIFFLLTDLFPSEIDPDPDLVNMISQLSEVDETTTSLAFVQSQMAKMLEAEDNKVRAMIMRLILKRMTARDAYFVILRLVRRANPFKRSHVISALSNHFSHPTSRLKRASNFIILPVLATRLMEETGELPLTPKPGDRLVMPLPTKYNPTLFYSSSSLEVIRGERLSFHKQDEMLIFIDPNGEIVEIEESSKDLLEEASIPNGIYLVEYVSQDSFPITMVDVRYSEDNVQDQPFRARREWLNEILSDLFIKEIKDIDNEQQLKHLSPKNGVVFLHNNDAIVDYDNSYNSVMRFSTKSTGQVFRLVGGIWQHDNAKGLRMSGWRVAARDGIDGYYEVGTIACEPILERKLQKGVEDNNAMEGNMALMKGVTFVDVEVHSADYDNRGIFIQGIITDQVPTAGMSDVTPVEEVEWLVNEE